METAIPFQDAAMESFSRVRKAVTAYVNAFPGVKKRARDFERISGLDYKLCWRLYQIIQAGDSLSGVSHIPKPKSLDLLVNAAQKAGVGETITDGLSAALRRYEEVVEEHAGDRADFEMIAKVASGQEVEEIDESLLRGAFHCNSHIWGVQMEAVGMTTIVRKSAGGEGNDECCLNSRVGFRRLRPGVPAVVYGHQYLTEYVPDEPYYDPLYEPLDVASAQRYGAPLLSAFSTQKMPRFTVTKGEDNFYMYEVADVGIGRRSAVNLAFGSVYRRSPVSKEADGKQLYFSSFTALSPSMVTILDLWVHRPSFGTVRPELLFYKRTRDTSSTAVRAAQQIPTGQKVQSLGTALRVTSTPEIPFYGDMVGFALETLKWAPEEFDLYRVRLPYQVLNSTLRLQFYLSG